MVLDDETPRLESIDMVTGEEQRHSPTRARKNDVNGPKPQGSSGTENSGHERQGLRFASTILTILELKCWEWQN